MLCPPQESAIRQHHHCDRGASSRQPRRTSPHPLQGKTSSPSPGLSVYSSMMSAMFPSLHREGLSRLLEDQGIDCGCAVSRDARKVAWRRRGGRKAGAVVRGVVLLPIEGPQLQGVRRWAVCVQGDPRLRVTLFGGGRRSGSAEGCRQPATARRVGDADARRLRGRFETGLGVRGGRSRGVRTRIEEEQMAQGTGRNDGWPRRASLAEMTD